MFVHVVTFVQCVHVRSLQPIAHFRDKQKKKNELVLGNMKCLQGGIARTYSWQVNRRPGKFAGIY
jgi:hypothetical protein